MASWARACVRRILLTIVSLTAIGCAVGAAKDTSAKETIYFVGIASPADPFHGVIARGAEQAGKDLGANVVYIFPDKVTLTDYNAKIEQAIAARPQGIVILGIDEKGSEPLAKRAHDLGIKLAFNPAPPIKERPLWTPDDLYISRVGSDEYSAGRAAADRLLREKVKGKVVCAIQIAGDVTLTTRCQGVTDRLKEAGVRTEVMEVANEPGELRNCSAPICARIPIPALSSRLADPRTPELARPRRRPTAKMCFWVGSTWIPAR